MITKNNDSTLFIIYLPEDSVQSDKIQASMDSIPVNWEALDALLIDFAKSEQLIEDSSPPSPPTPSSSSYRWRLLIRQIRYSLESGDVDSAIDLLQSHSPDVLNDHRLLFRLQKQVCNFRGLDFSI